jgi:hypothetical protein
MTELLEKAFTEVSKLPKQEQDNFAAWIIEEIVSEHRWEENFAKSQDLLEKLAEEALNEHTEYMELISRL